jgi:hypothetical protein
VCTSLASPSSTRQPADIEHILDAVRKSEELHHAKMSTPPAVCGQASTLSRSGESSAKIGEGSSSAKKITKTKSKETSEGQEGPEGKSLQNSTTASSDVSDGASLSEAASSPEDHTPRPVAAACEPPELEVELVKPSQAETVQIVPDPEPEVTRAQWADMDSNPEEWMPCNPEDLSMPNLPMPEESDLSLPMAPCSPSKNSRRAGRRRRRSGAKGAETESIMSPGNTLAGTSIIPEPPSEINVLGGAGRAVDVTAKSPSTSAARRNVVTLSDLGFDLAPAAAPAAAVSPCSKPRTQPPIAVCSNSTSWAAPAPPTCWATSPCSPVGWQQQCAWGEHTPEPASNAPIMRTGPCVWGAGTVYEASQRSPHRTPTASTGADHGIAFRSWLQASGLPSSGVELAEKLRVVAPEAYED